MESEAVVSSHDQNESENMQNIVNVIHTGTDHFLSADSTHVKGVVSHFPPPLMLLQDQNQNQVPDGIAVAVDPLSDPVIQSAVDFRNYIDQRRIGGGQGGIFQAVPNGNDNPIDQSRIGSQCFDDQDMITLPLWPQPPQPFNCSCCELLREICHTNGTVALKLEIHGKLGEFYHAIQGQKNVDQDSLGNYQRHQMFDFSRKSMEEVKQFIIDYCFGRNLAGFAMLPDPLRAHHEVYHIAFDWNDDLGDGFDLECSLSSEESVGDKKSNEPVSSAKPSISAQRERAGKLTLQELSNYFHLPIEEAAKQVNLCPTVVKRVCRRHGLVRWPYRKIKSTKRRLSVLRKSLGSGDAGVRARAHAQIQRLEQYVKQNCAGILPSSIHFD